METREPPPLLGLPVRVAPPQQKFNIREMSCSALQGSAPNKLCKGGPKPRDKVVDAQSNTTLLFPHCVFGERMECSHNSDQGWADFASDDSQGTYSLYYSVFIAGFVKKQMSS